MQRRIPHVGHDEDKRLPMETFTVDKIICTLTMILSHNGKTSDP